MDMREINEGVIREFRANDGQLTGPMQGAPILLLTTTGRRMGEPHTTPLGFIDVDGRLALAAANGGSDDHPDWYLNIEHDHRVTVEVPGATIPSVARIAAGGERAELLQVLTDTLPGMADHVAAANRDIPVILVTEAG